MLTLGSNSLKVVVTPKGAELCSVKNLEGTEFIWQADKNVWPRHAPVLFPIVGRLKDNFYLHKGKTYELPQHGFARDREFILADFSREHCLFRLSSDPETKKLFPFDFILGIEYILKGDALTIKYSVKNSSQDEMFFSIGAHPGFSLPLGSGIKYEDHYLEFETDALSFTTLQEGLLSKNYRKEKLNKRKLFLTEDLFENDALILENNQVNKISLCSSKSEHKITMVCKDWPYFGIWSKKGCKDFICLEPWYGITDSVDSDQQLENKKGIISLQAEEEFNCSYTIEIK